MTALAFVLGNFWHFIGAAILLVILLEGLAGIVRAVRESNPWHD